MIVFNGQISGKAEAHYWQTQANLGSMLLIGASVACSPILLIFWNVPEYLLVVAVAYLLVAILLPLLPQLLKKALSNPKYLPMLITIDGNNLVCQTSLITENRTLQDVKCVKQYDEYYTVHFFMGKASIHYVCQKSLLTIGSLAEFEALFSEKMVDCRKK